ncbi:unnamed protein product [Bemisia tabaci]|uniref:Uncharacterized protein n=1 Tax=Bemisia tabaci TaxID=7038 RepID=A0A9P0F541_BEMTA|nr:unnamed protein product [Bemisia tabaci]
MIRDQTDVTITDPAAPEAVTPDAIVKALSIVIATKANLYLMNHHTGQGPLQGYAKKVALVQYPTWRENDTAVVTCIHTIGHWASTLAVFHIAQVPGIRALSGPTYTKSINIVFSNDAKLRFAGMPAGTARHSIAYEGAKRLVRNMLGQLCPNLSGMSALPGIRKSIMESRIAYHIGASYFTGKARMDFEDTSAEDMLSRIGTFILAMMPKSTLAQSPYLTQAKVESYPDYDPQWSNTLIQFKASAAAGAGEALRRVLNESSVASAEAVEKIKRIFSRGDRKEPPVDDEETSEAEDMDDDPPAGRGAPKRKAPGTKPSTKTKRTAK